jgi:hypothetical protein
VQRLAENDGEGCVPSTVQSTSSATRAQNSGWVAGS